MGEQGPKTLFLGLQLFASASPLLAMELGRLGDRLRRTYCMAARGGVQVMEAVNGTPVEQRLGRFGAGRGA